MVLVLTTTSASAQDAEKDLWTRSIDVTLGDDWRQKNISVPGKGEPNVLDFFRAFAQAYPCEYHELLAQAIDGDETVKFNHKKPYIHIDRDSCLLENESFAMRVFYDKNKPAALGVCCHTSLTREAQDAYYYRYDRAHRLLKPMAQGSDFTGGMVRRKTSFPFEKQNNEVMMTHIWGRCGISNVLVWNHGKFTYEDRTKTDLEVHEGSNVAMSLLENYLWVYEMELRPPKRETEECGGSYNSLPICIAIIDEHSGGSFAAASAMEGFYYFYARAWKKTDGTTLVAVYTECAPRFDHDYDPETHKLVGAVHKLGQGDEVGLKFYLCNCSGKAVYLDPASPQFAKTVGQDLPDLEHNEWRCLLGPDNENLVFVSEADGQRKSFTW